MHESSASATCRPGLILGKLPALAAFAAVGILIADSVSPPLWSAGIATLVLFGIVVAVKPPAARWLLPLLAGAVFATMHLVRLDGEDRFPLADTLASHSAVTVSATGIVADEPRATAAGDRFKYTLALTTIAHADDHWHTWHRIAIDQPGPPPAYGDLLSLSGNLEALRPARNPGEFSLESFYSRKGIVAEIYLAEESSVRLLEKERGNPVFALALKSREWIRRAITRDLDDAPDVGAVLSAMVLGDRSATPREIEERFRHSGALHIFAVSGLHVGIFGTIIWVFLRLFGLRRPQTVLIIIPCLFFYAYVTGLRPSAFRAAIMASIFLSGFLFMRQPRLLNSLAAAALVILACDSQQLYLPGFQLSFAVLATIALFAGPIQRPLVKLLEPDPFLPSVLVPGWRKSAFHFGRWGAGLFAVSTAAWIGSAPLGLFHFQLVTPIALIANCLLVPIAWMILVVASLSLASSAIGLAGIGVLFNNANWLAAKLLLATTSLFSSVPGGHFYVDHVPTWSRDDCRVTILDTGLGGSAQLVSFSDPDTSILIDAGGHGTYHESVLPFLRGALHSRPEGLVITHGDVQHLAGAIPLLRDFPPRHIFQSSLDNRSPYYRDLLESLETSPGPQPVLRTVSAGEEVFASPKSSLRLLYPPEGKRHDYASDDQCIVLRLTCDSWRVLFMADSGFATEKWLLENAGPGELDCDILVKGRHRSDYSGLPEFLNAATPQVVIATNFSFPVEEQIPSSWEEMLFSRGIRLLDQSKTGAVSLRLSSDRLSVSCYLTGESFEMERR